MARIRPKNWSEFQHYRDRDPTWIKLHKRLLDDFTFHRLPLSSRALAPMLWLIASEDKDGWFDGSPEAIAFRLRLSTKEVREAINPLIEAGFFVLEQHASEPLAEPERDASPEKERQVETEKQVKTERSPASAGGRESFDDFWKAYPKREARGAAVKAFAKALEKTDAQTLIAAAGAYAAKRAGQDRQFTKQPATWLNQECWTDDGIAPASKPDEQAVAAASAAWSGHAAPLVEEIGPTKFDAWFGGASFEIGPPARITFPKPFQKNWVAKNYTSQLRKHYGDFQLEVAA